MSLTKINTDQINGILPVAQGGTGLDTLPAGRIPFGTDTSSFGSNAMLTWDNATKMLGVNNSTPLYTVDIQGVLAALNILNTGTAGNAGAGSILLGSSRPVADGTYANYIASMLTAQDSGHQEIVEIYTRAEGTTSGKRGGKLVFITKKDNSTSWNTALSLNNKGQAGIGTENPNSTIQNTGSEARVTIEKTESYTPGENDNVILCNHATVSILITLPSCSGIAGRTYVIKNIGVATLDITKTDGLIDGGGSIINIAQWKSRTLITDGSNWFVIGGVF